MKSNNQKLTSLMSILAVAVLFQNCGPDGFRSRISANAEIASQEILEPPQDTTPENEGQSLSSASKSADAWHVATTGSNSNDGKFKPFKTIEYASGKMKSGDTLFIHAGTYLESMDPSSSNFKFTNGTLSKYTIYTAAPGDERKVIIKPSRGSFVAYFATDKAYIEIRGLVLDGTNVNQVVKFDASFTPTVKNAHDIRLVGNDIRNSVNSAILGGAQCEIRDNLIHNAGGYGIYTGTGNGGGVVDGNSIYNNGGFAIHHYHVSRFVKGWIIRNNKIYNNGKGHWKLLADGSHVWREQTAVILSRGSGSQFYNNIVYNNPNGGVQIRGATDMLVANNTIYGNGLYGISIEGSKNTRVLNNISYKNNGPQIDNRGENTTLGQNLISDPKFVNSGLPPIEPNFHLRAGSQAIDAGRDIDQVTTDIEGKPRIRGRMDIGAYAY